MKITLRDWAAQHFDPVPSDHTLRRLAREGRITPPPVKVGKLYYVEQAARLWDDVPAAGERLVDRLRRGGR